MPSARESVRSLGDSSVMFRPGPYGKDTVTIRTYRHSDPWQVDEFPLMEVLAALSRVTGRKIMIENTPGMSEVPV